jgi:pimeloyl-ACP methyl ester carboxylesterase
MNKPVVLVHGAWHGPWCWDRVTPHLDAAGVPWVAPDLPSCLTASAGSNVTDDDLAVRRAIDALAGNEQVILLGHSRGGGVITESGTHDRVGHLVYLAAFLGDEDEDATRWISPGLYSALESHDDGTTTVRADMGAEVFYNECSGKDFAWAAQQLRPQSHTPLETASQLAWKHKPSTYVVCSRDNAIPAEGQRVMAARSGSMVEWNTDHSPFANRPELVAALLIGLSVGS